MRFLRLPIGNSRKKKRKEKRKKKRVEWSRLWFWRFEFLKRSLGRDRPAGLLPASPLSAGPCSPTLSKGEGGGGGSILSPANRASIEELLSGRIANFGATSPTVSTNEACKREEHKQVARQHQQSQPADADAAAVGARMQARLIKHRRTPEWTAMMVGCREALPATAAREAVLSAVSSNDVTIISGGTGCGKSTQVPQFLLDTIIENDRAGHESVLCAQPRRIAAVSVAAAAAAAAAAAQLELALPLRPFGIVSSTGMASSADAASGLKETFLGHSGSRSQTVKLDTTALNLHHGRL